MPNSVGKLTGPREQWDAIIDQAFADKKATMTIFFFHSVLRLLLDIREMLIVNNMMQNQTMGLLAQATGAQVVKQAGGVILP